MSNARLIAVALTARKQNYRNVMIADSITSCSYLVLGSGYCVYRLAKYSSDAVSKVLPEFIIASIGIVALGGRSIHALFYNLLWRSYRMFHSLFINKVFRYINSEYLYERELSKFH